MPRLNGKFVSQATYDEHMKEQARMSDESTTTADDETPRRTRQADPLLAAKRRLEAARKAQARAQKKADAVTSVQEELEAANAELSEAEAAFQQAVDGVLA